MGVINLMKGLFYGGNHMYYIGVDLGTSSLKLLLMDEKGKIQNIVSKEYNLYFPKEGWAEQNPQDWWRAFETGILELLEDYDAKEVEGISFGGQMHGLVILDDHDEVIRPAILWNDGRDISKRQNCFRTHVLPHGTHEIYAGCVLRDGIIHLGIYLLKPTYTQLRP